MYCFHGFRFLNDELWTELLVTADEIQTFSTEFSGIKLLLALVHEVIGVVNKLNEGIKNYFLYVLQGSEFLN